jgi:hypothetical protein
MRWYKILARILLMLSVIDFTLAAPVVVQEHEVRISVDTAKDGTATLPLRRDPSDKWLANAADPTNAPRSSDSGHWRGQEPKQHNPRRRRYFNDAAPPKDPSPDGSPQIASSPDRSPSFGSWLPADSHSGSTGSSWSAGESWESVSTTEESHPSSPDQLSTGESHPPSPGQINHPPPAPPSEPGLSTRPHPTPGAEFSDEEKNVATILIDISRQGFRPRTYGSSAVDAAKGELLGTIDTRVYVSASPFPLLPTFKRPESRIF